MSIEFELDDDRSLIRTRVIGAINLKELEDYFRAITHSDQFPPDLPALVDFCEADFSVGSRQLAEQLVRLRKRFPERESARVAFLVSDELGFGLTRMYQILNDDSGAGTGGRSRVFRSVDDALAWLKALD